MAEAAFSALQARALRPKSEAAIKSDELLGQGDAKAE
jgi:hypothetical protein